MDGKNQDIDTQLYSNFESSDPFVHRSFKGFEQCLQQMQVLSDLLAVPMYQVPQNSQLELIDLLSSDTLCGASRDKSCLDFSKSLFRATLVKSRTMLLIMQAYF